MEGKDGRTEPATAKKRSEARQKGQVCVSPEIISLVVLAMSMTAIWMMAPKFYVDLGGMIVNAARFEDLHNWTGAKVAVWFRSGCVTIGTLLAPLFFCVLLGTVAANMVQTGPLIASEALKAKFNALNPATNIRQLFSLQSIISMLTSLLKVGFMVGIVYVVLWKEMDTVLSLHNFSTFQALQWTLKLVFRICMTILCSYIVIAVIDWIVKHREYEKSLMMTKQEVKEEARQQEPSPIIKRAQMKKMREFSMMHMMAAVPKANVIITNPTHVAIALAYDPETMDAPKVVAKGLRLVAQRIKAIAAENNIPIVERPEVARSLYKHVKIGREIPSKFYEVVAEVLAFIHKIGYGIKIA